MKGFIFILSCILLLFLVVEQSGTFSVGKKMVMDGTIKVERTSWEWHPEKFVPYVNAVCMKWVGKFFKPMKHAGRKNRKELKPKYRLYLKNGSMIPGTVIREDAKGLLFRSQEGEIFFSRSEILSLEKE